MKKKISAFVFVMLTAVSVAVLANSREENVCTHSHSDIATHVEMQGKHCNGTVGCGCPGFAPITNGKVWQEGYCRHCGHARTYHKF